MVLLINNILSTTNASWMYAGGKPPTPLDIFSKKRIGENLHASFWNARQEQDARISHRRYIPEVLFSQPSQEN